MVSMRASAEDAGTRVKFARERLLLAPSPGPSGFAGLERCLRPGADSLGPELIIGLIFLDDPPENVGGAKRKEAALLDGPVPSVPTQAADRELGAVERPELGHLQGCVDALAIDFRRREVNLDGEVRVGVITSVF